MTALWIVVGAFIGYALGMLTVALCVMSSRGDDGRAD